MLKNYVTVALRNIFRQKLFSGIKIFGLALGIAACLIIYLFVVDELSFDSFHENKDRLFRVVQSHYDKGTLKETGFQQYIPPPTGPELEKQAPEIEHQTRYTNGEGVVRYRDKLFRETLWLADAPFFLMFSFTLLQGEARAVLEDDHNVVLSRSCAQKYFGRENPTGETLSMTFGDESRDFIVTGIVEDTPLNSSLRFDILIHINNLPAVLNNPEILDDWDRWYCPLYVMLKPDISEEDFQARLDQFSRLTFSAAIQEQSDEGADPFTFVLQRIDDIHLDSRFGGSRGLTPSFLLSGIALAILLIAYVNFMNLSIGLASQRSKEVGMRKVLGAERRQLVGQFICEALLISTCAVLLGVLLAEFFLPQFNLLSEKKLSLNILFTDVHVVVLPAFAVIAGFCSGIYPAFVISSFHPVAIMKGRLKVGGRNTITKGLIIVQFSLSMILAVSGILLGKQVSYMIHKDPGYASRGLVVVLTQETEQKESERIYQRFRYETASSSQVLSLTASNREFGVFLPGSTLTFKGRNIHYRFNRVDPHFLSTMKIELVGGRDFSENIDADKGAVVVNQEFIDQLGPDYRMEEPLGDTENGFPYDRRVIGVMENCHFESLRSQIEPLLLYVGQGESPRRNRFSRIFVRTGTMNMVDTRSFLEAAWRRVQPEKPFISFLQDDVLKGMYLREKRWSAVVRYGFLFSIVLACLGIFGLTALTLSRRVKEIGIRKIMGARVPQLVYIGIKDFIWLVLIANFIAWPLVYVIMTRILRNYPYHIAVGFQYFFLAGMFSLLISMLTVLSLTMKAASQNPCESLRNE